MTSACARLCVPRSLFLATLSADRSCRVYGPLAPKGGKETAKPDWDAFGNNSVALRHYDLPLAASDKQQPAAAAGGEDGAAAAPAAAAASAGGKKEAAATKKQSLFHDEAVTTFFRRLAFSPDGTFLALPAGVHRRDSSTTQQHNTTYLVRRGAWTRPAVHLPVRTRTCPSFFSFFRWPACLFLCPVRPWLDCRSWRPLCYHHRCRAD